MQSAPIIQSLDWKTRPLDVLAGWPEHHPVMLLYSGGGHPRWARWSILASPEGWYTFDGRSRVSGAVPAALARGLTHDPLCDLDLLVESTRTPRRPSGRPRLPFVGGWIGTLGYELGREIEPAARARSGGGRSTRAGWPLVEFAFCPRALLHDNRSGRWFAVGSPGAGGMDEWWFDPRRAPRPAKAAAPRIGRYRSSLTPAAYMAAVARTINLIEDGDVFQANLTQRLTASFAGSPRRLAARTLARAEPWYGGLLELPGGRAIVSMSPELLLDVDGATRRVVTRPIKGTRPRRVDRRELIESEKDAAELHMIVDLMRNDLGRVCRYGSIRVPRARTIETHGRVHHGVGEVVGTLREGVGLGELLRATFPAGSVTGAPKIRAMQIIEELEPVTRGPYCGAMGFISGDGSVRLNVAIRTAVVTGAVIDYAVGGGIVADSDPAAEYQESLDKVVLPFRRDEHAGSVTVRE